MLLLSAVGTLERNLSASSSPPYLMGGPWDCWEEGFGVCSPVRKAVGLQDWKDETGISVSYSDCTAGA